MEPPKILKSFLLIIGFLVFLMILNILTSANYLYTVVTLSQTYFTQHILSVRHLSTPMVTDNTTSQKTYIFGKLGVNVTGQDTGPGVKDKPKLQTKITAQNTTKTNAHKVEQSRAENCNKCLKHNFKHLIQNDGICNRTEKQTIDLLIVILTIHNHKKQRDDIRKTWLAISDKNRSNVRYAFLLGKISNKELMKSVYEENKVYSDLLMEDFTDAYGNLTYKTIMGMKFATLHCRKARFIMKTDDDMWVNVPDMLKMLNSKEKELQNSIGGVCFNVAQPIRDKRSKWYASIKSYPQQRYPGFCSGTGYVTSLAVAEKLYEISSSIPFFHLEDVYMSLCIKKLGMTLRNIQGFHNWRAPMNPCQMKSPGILTSHEVPTAFLHKIMAAKC